MYHNGKSSKADMWQYSLKIKARRISFFKEDQKNEDSTSIWAKRS